MKKLYKVVLLILTLIFLSTFNPIKTENFFNKKSLLRIEKIEIVNNHIIKKNKILEKLHNIYGKNILLVKGREIIGPLKSINFLEKIEVKKNIQAQ